MFEFSYFLELLPKLFSAAAVNLRLSVVIAVISLFAAILLTIVRIQKIKILNIAINIFISFIRGTPLLVQIFLCFYVLPSVGVDLEPVTAGILAISLNCTVFVAETMRGGLQTIDPGQIEAATALGLKWRHIWQKILLPQLLIRILPMLVNEMTIIIKGTALLSVITVVDVMRTAQQMGNSTFRPFESLLGAGLVFFVMNAMFIFMGMYLENRSRARMLI